MKKQQKSGGQVFPLIGLDVKFSEEQLRYFAIRNDYRGRVYQAVNKALSEFYDVFEEFDDLHEKGPAWFNQYLQPMVQYAISELGKMKYYDLDPEAFIELMDTSDVDKSLNRVLAKKAEVESEEEERENRRASRTEAAGSAWAGGGFGVSGAIKGAATAGALNLGGAAVSGIFNMVGRGISACANAAKLRDFLKSDETRDDYINTLAGLLWGVRDTFIAVAEKNCKGFKVKQLYSSDRQLSERIMKNIKTGVVGKEDIPENIVRAIETYPYSEEIYQYLAENYDDEDLEIENLAGFFNFDIVGIKQRKLDDFFKTLPKKTEKQMLDGRKLMARKAQEIGLKDYSKYEPLEKMILEYDRQARTFNGVEYPDRETARKHSELFDFFKKLDLNEEQKALDARKTIADKAEELHLTLEKTGYPPLEKVISDFDILARTAGNKVFKTREEADLQRRKIQLNEYFKSLHLKKEQDAIQARQLIIDKAKSLDLPAMKEYKPLEQLIEQLHIRERNLQLAAFFASAKSKRIHVYPDIPEDKLASALGSYKAEIRSDDVIVLADDTLLGGCEDGLIVTGDSVFVHDSGTRRTTIASPVKVTAVKGWSGIKIFINNDQVAKLTMPDADAVTALCSGIQELSGNSSHGGPLKNSDSEGTSAAPQANGPEKAKKKSSRSKAAASKDTPKTSKKVKTAPSDIFSGIRDDKIFPAPDIPSKKLGNALKSFAPSVSANDVLVLIDDTLFGGCKDGFLITREAIYAKEFMSEPVKKVLSPDLQFLLDEKTLLINGEHFFKFTCAEKAALEKVVEGLRILADQ